MIEQPRKVSCLVASVMIGFRGGLRGEEFLLASLEGMLKFWEETRIMRNQYHIMVTLRGRFKGETGGKWHMLPLVDVTGLGIEISRLVGRWLEIMVEEEARMEDWMFQHREGNRMNISDMDEVFQQVLRRVKLEEVGLIPEGVEVAES